MPTAPKFIGARNYARLLTDPEIWGYFRTTAYFVILAVTAQFLIGFGLALLLNRQFRAKGFRHNTAATSDDAISSGGRSLLAVYSCLG